MRWCVERSGHAAIMLDREISIGRDPACTVALDDPSVSRVQCRLRVSGGSLVLHDEGRYGTLVNGTAVGRHALLADGDVLHIRHERFVIRLVPGESPPSDRDILPAYVIDVIENAASAGLPYRDAVALGDEGGLLFMADVVSAAQPVSAELVAKWKAAIRTAVRKSPAPDDVLNVMHAEMLGAGLTARANCARLDVADRVLLLASAGARPPWILRSTGRTVHIPVAQTVELGRVKKSHFPVRAVHFGRGDTLWVPSEQWAADIEASLAAASPPPAEATAWLRTLPIPAGGCVLSLRMT